MTSSTNSSGAIRLGGLTSGFDTESIIKQLLAPDQARIDKLKQDQEVNTAKIQTWQDMADQLKSLAATVTALKADGTGSNTLFDNKSVASSSSTVATASAASTAVKSSYSLTVGTLARAHVIYGSQKTSSYTLPAPGSVILNGTTITFAGGESLQEMATLINAGAYQNGEEVIASVVDNRLTLQTKSTGASADIHGTAAGSPPFVLGTDDPDGILQTEMGLIDGSGDIVNEAQTSADASFTVNGIPITSASNTVTGAITGVTINLLSTGNSTLKVSVDTAKIKETITDFVDLYNETRDLIDRTRNAKLNETDQFGLFFSDPLMRQLYNDLRSLTTTGVKMGVSDWDGTVTVSGAASAGATQVSVSGFTAANGTLSKGDMFVFPGDSTVYRLQNDVTIAGNAATLDLNPPLQVALSGGEAANVAIRTLEDFGVGVRTDTVSGVDGVLGILDEGKLDALLDSDVDLVKSIFGRAGDTQQQKGVARRLYEFIDQQTTISVFTNSNRAIDNLKIEGLNSQNDDLDEQIARLEEQMKQKEDTLVKRFSDMEAALSRSQSAGSALSGITGGSQQGN